LIKSIKLFFIALLLLNLISCAKPILIKQGSIEVKQDIEQIIEKVCPQFENAIEQHILYENLYNFSYYLKAQYGLQKWRSFVESIMKGSTISMAAINVYNKTPYQLGAEMFYKIYLSSAYDDNTLLTTRDFEILRIHFCEISQAAQDYDYIKYLLNIYYKQLFKHFFNNTYLQDRFKENMSNINDKKIEVFLLSNKTMIKKNFGNPDVLAETALGYSRIGDEYVLNAQLNFKYYNLLSTSVFIHELTHMLFLLASLDPKQTQRHSISEPKIKQKLTNIVRHISEVSGGVLGEGFAEYVNEQYNLFYKYKIFDDIDTQLRTYFKNNNLMLHVGDLPRKIKSWNLKERVLAYQVAHSVCRYIIKKYGNDKFVKLLKSPQNNEDYINIIGIDLEQLDKEWNSHIREEL